MHYQSDSSLKPLPRAHPGQDPKPPESRPGLRATSRTVLARTGAASWAAFNAADRCRNVDPFNGTGNDARRSI
ncbi:MAG: hypothetical protein ACRYF3_13550 [Janthinobacterium lividum]